MPTLKTLAHSITGVSDVTDITVNESMNTATNTAVIKGYDTTLSLGDSISFNMGYLGDTGKLFTGYVRKIIWDLPTAQVEVICEDELSKAVDFFLASSTPDNPFARSNISTEDLVEDLLNQAQITNYTANVPLSVTWGTNGPIEFNLVTVWSAVSSIARMLAWHVYADRNGQVHLTRRPPYVEGSDTADFTWSLTTDNLLSTSAEDSTEELRNKVVVYGKPGVSATASASSPFLPAGFFKTAVISTPIIDTNSLAQRTADLNLERFNRLTKSAVLQIEGDYNVEPRKIVNVTEPYTGLSGDWVIYHVETKMDSSGFTQIVTLRD